MTGVGAKRRRAQYFGGGRSDPGRCVRSLVAVMTVIGVVGALAWPASVGAAASPGSVTARWWPAKLPVGSAVQYALGPFAPAPMPAGLAGWRVVLAPAGSPVPTPDTVYLYSGVPTVPTPFGANQVINTSELPDVVVPDLLPPFAAYRTSAFSVGECGNVVAIGMNLARVRATRDLRCRLDPQRRWIVDNVPAGLVVRYSGSLYITGIESTSVMFKPLVDGEASMSLYTTVFGPDVASDAVVSWDWPELVVGGRRAWVLDTGSSLTTAMVLVAPNARVVVSGSRRDQVLDAAASLQELSEADWKARVGAADVTATAVTVPQPAVPVTAPSPTVSTLPDSAIVTVPQPAPPSGSSAGLCRYVAASIIGRLIAPVPLASVRAVDGSVGNAGVCSVVGARGVIFEIRSEATKLSGAKLAAELQARLVGGRSWRQPGGSIRGVTRGNAVVASDGRRIVSVAAFLDGATVQGERHSAGTAGETLAVAVLKQQRSGVVPVSRRVTSASA